MFQEFHIYFFVYLIYALHLLPTGDLGSLQHLNMQHLKMQ